MSQEGSFRDLMDRLGTGDENAARRVFDRYAQRLIALAGGRLDRAVRQKVDPEDVVQSVFRSFFSGARFDLGSWDGLWRLLVVITLRKCGRRVEYFHASRRNVRREVPWPATSGDGGAAMEALADDPTPSEAAVLTEAVEGLLRGLDEGGRNIVALSLQGHTVAEICDRLGRTQRSVYRVLERVKKKLQPKLAEDKVGR